MPEQTAILMQDHGEWVLIADDDEPERVWQELDPAMTELQSEGWRIVQGPAAIEPDVPEIDRFKAWGYRLKRSIQ